MGPSPLILSRLNKYLSLHPDPLFASYIGQGLHFVFRIGFSNSLSALASSLSNHPSTQDNPTTVSSHIEEELRLGWLVGPLPQEWATRVQTSPMGLVPKPHSHKWRHLSSPRGRSVNDGIPSSFCSLSYASVDEAVEVISSLGLGTNLIKIDLSNTYRMVPVHPADQHLLGIRWQGSTYLDRALPFGLRSAPNVFTAVADLLAWALFCEGIHFVIHYLDDFLIFVPPGLNPIVPKQIVKSVFRYLNAPVADQKTEGPDTSLVFLGIRINTITFQLSLPQSRSTAASVDT